MSGSPILWQNADQTVTLFDIPRSISAAQGAAERVCSHTILSCQPLEHPFCTSEPKSKAAKSKLQRSTVEEAKHQDIAIALQQALDEVKGQVHHSWCLTRPFVKSMDSMVKKRKPDDDARVEASKFAASMVDSALIDLSRTDTSSTHPGACDECNATSKSFHANCSDSPSLLNVEVHSSQDTECTEFHIPPGSSFYLGDCAESRAFHTCIRNQASVHDSRRHFDAILLDPPWPNRSVKHSRQTPGRGYSTPRSIEDVHRLVMNMDLDLLMASDCLIGVWITNRPSIRELVLEDVFPQWGVEPLEEWIWLKTTCHGEPMTPVNGLWREPYEVLLLGRKHRTCVSTSLADKIPPKRRILVAVPDLHSRKPCLKELIEPLMSVEKDKRVLEIFARHLVAGWWSWGNECIRFNSETNWRPIVQKLRRSSEHLT